MTQSDARARPRERLRPDAEPQREAPSLRKAAARQRTAYRKAPKQKIHNRVGGWLSRFVFQTTIALGVFGWITFGGADPILNWSRNAVEPKIVSEASANSVSNIAPWIVDVDGDGAGDFANPCQASVRGHDEFGSGLFQARRDAGARKHHGVDFVAAPGALVRAPIAGVVTELGAVYRDTAKLRFVEVTNEVTKLTARVFYVSASVTMGDHLAAGDVIGLAQSLQQRYPGITNHVHVELRNQGRLLNPADYLPFFPGQALRAELPTLTHS